MTIQETINSVRASFAMEDQIMTREDEIRGRAILTGEKTIDEVITELSKKYATVNG